MRRSRDSLAAAILMVALLASVVAVAHAEQDDLVLVSRAPGTTGAPGDGNSSGVSVSADGRFVAFESGADSLSGEDSNAVQNVFVRDLETGATIYVSRATGATGTAGDGNSFQPSVSADGRRVAFSSDADSLSGEDTDAVRNVFVRDLQTGVTTYVSRASGVAGAPGDAESFAPAVSADGRFVAFESFADSLSGEDSNAVVNVFVRDLQADATDLVSRASGAAGTPADGSSSGASISADGRVVAFDSFADSLSGGDDNTVVNVFARDRQTATTTYVSRESGVAGTAGRDDSLDPAISADGRFVAFESDANNLSGGDHNDITNIFVRDLGSAATRYVSRASGAVGEPGGDDSFEPAISADGRRVAFESLADSLSGEDDNAVRNVFVRDLATDETIFASRASGMAGARGDAESFAPAISADGRFVAFDSFADSLSAEDNNAFRNVFVRDLGRPLPQPPPQPESSPPPPPPPPAPQAAAGGPLASPLPSVSRADAFAGCPARTVNVIEGTEAGDAIGGTPRGDRVFSLAGDDRVDGLAGDDCVDLGAGEDRAQGGVGDDLLRGRAGEDRVAGGHGGDRMSGGAGADALSGGSGRDRVSGDAGGDRIGGDAGDDVLSGNSGDDRLTGGAGRDSLAGGAGNDHVDARDGERDRIACGRGRDTVIADRVDRVARDCERVRRTSPRRVAASALAAESSHLAGCLAPSTSLGLALPSAERLQC